MCRRRVATAFTKEGMGLVKLYLHDLRLYFYTSASVSISISISCMEKDWTTGFLFLWSLLGYKTPYLSLLYNNPGCDIFVFLFISL